MASATWSSSVTNCLPGPGRRTGGEGLSVHWAKTFILIQSIPLKTSDNQSTSKPEAAEKDSPSKAKKSVKPAKAKPEAAKAAVETSKGKAVKSRATKAAATMAEIPKKKAAGTKKAAAAKPKPKVKAVATPTADEPLVPRLDRSHVANAAYFRFQKRLAYGHSPDPLADWFAAEAELMREVGVD